jgi:hypothetical protein
MLFLFQRILLACGLPDGIYKNRNDIDIGYGAKENIE